MLNTEAPKQTHKTDDEFQSYLLNGVSRTFALTIPQLPEGLRNVVSNAYLLCRTVDTVEDEPALSPEQKRKFCDWFVEVLENRSQATLFSNALTPLLSKSTLPLEHELIAQIHRVIEITRSFAEPQQKALARCIKIMAEGMAYFQELDTSNGLQRMEEMDKYCYYVAGVVGEMLTELFCHYLQDELGPKKEEMMKLAVSFGQGLQMTNILKDIWEDKKRGACWLPRDIFQEAGYNLADMETGRTSVPFQQGVMHLVGVTHAHLKNAFRYTLMIPPREEGIRKFCLWALGMAVMNLQKIKNNITYTESDQVKISRKTVKRVVAISHLSAKHNGLLKLLFNLARAGLPVKSGTFKA